MLLVINVSLSCRNYFAFFVFGETSEMGTASHHMPAIVQRKDHKDARFSFPEDLYPEQT